MNIKENIEYIFSLALIKKYSLQKGEIKRNHFYFSENGIWRIKDVNVKILDENYHFMDSVGSFNVIEIGFFVESEKGKKKWVKFDL